MARGIQDAWSAYRALAGPADALVAKTRRGGRTGGLSGIMADQEMQAGQQTKAYPGCTVAETWERGYWPYPWSEMPPGGLPFDPFGSITTPAANGTETVALQFEVPYGYDGIITGIANAFTGPGFVEGSGDLTWRIRVGQPNLQGRPQRNYSSIQQSMGSVEQPREVPGGIQVVSNQFIEYSVVHAIGSPIVPAGTRIICNIQGYYWPRGSTPLDY